jgi:hypothetical protein
MDGWCVLACVLLVIFIAFIAVVSARLYKHRCEQDEKILGYLEEIMEINKICEQMLEDNITYRSIIDNPIEYLRQQEEDGNI